MIRRPPRSTRTDTRFPTRRSSDLGAENIMRRGKRLAGTRINEPQPRRSTGGWSPFKPAVMAVHDFARPTVKPNASFAEVRSEEHTSELQSLMRNSYAVFCLIKKQHTRNPKINQTLSNQILT